MTPGATLLLLLRGGDLALLPNPVDTDGTTNGSGGSVGSSGPGGGGTGGLPASLLAALKTYWNGASGLATAVGPLYAGTAKGGTDPPYARVQEVVNRGHFDTGPGGVEYVDLQFSIFAGGEQAAEDLGRLVRQALDAPSLAFADGYLIGIRRTGGQIMADPHLDTQARRVWHKALTFRAILGRELA